MAEYVGIVSGTGNPASRINEISPDDVATIRNYIIGFSSGVIMGFGETHNIAQISIQSGLMFAYGYLGYTAETATFYFYPKAAKQYHFIYIELNKSVVPNTCKLKVKNNQGSNVIKDTTFRQDILSNMKTGIFQLPLYCIEIDDTGIADVTDLRDTKLYINKVKNAVDTHNVTGTIANSVTGVTQQIVDNSTRIATTAFVYIASRDKIDSLATFYVGNYTLRARRVNNTQNETWESWVNSPFNTIGAYIIDPYIYIDNRRVLFAQGSVSYQEKSYRLTTNETYYLQ